MCNMFNNLLSEIKLTEDVLPVFNDSGEVIAVIHLGAAYLY